MSILTKKTHPKKRLTKRAYIYLALVTMAIVSLFTKPIKRGFSSLEKYLASVSQKKAEKLANVSEEQGLRTNLKKHSPQQRNLKQQLTDKKHA